MDVLSGGTDIVKHGPYPFSPDCSFDYLCLSVRFGSRCGIVVCCVDCQQILVGFESHFAGALLYFVQFCSRLFELRSDVCNAEMIVYERKLEGYIILLYLGL